MVSKVKLSAADWQTAADPHFILTKNRIIDGVYQLFGQVAAQWQWQHQPLAARLPAVYHLSAKISRGEKHEDMPWVMLDYPRCFDAESGHMALRCMFWWGHHFSVRLQLSGQRLQQFAALPGLLPHWQAALTPEPWDQHIPGTQWQPWQPLPADARVGIITKKHPIEAWDAVALFYEKAGSELVTALLALA